MRRPVLSDILSDMSEDAQTYGERLKSERERLGWSLEEVMFRARVALGKPISAKTIHRLENGTTSEAAADERLVVTLCRVYGVEPREISPAIAERAELLMAVLVGTSGPDMPGGEQTGLTVHEGLSKSEWTHNSADPDIAAVHAARFDRMVQGAREVELFEAAS